MQLMADHDHAYKLLFTQEEMTAHLLGWLAARERRLRGLDLSTLEQFGSRHISDDWRERENDVMWRVRRRNGLFLYLLIEFQSAPDPYMAARVMTYKGNLYQDLVRRRKLGSSRKLPEVFAIVLYNGERPWKGALQISEATEKGTGGPETGDRLRFALVDIRRLRPEEMVDEGNLAATLFRLENSRSLEEVERELDGLRKRLSEPHQMHLLQAFLSWLRRVLMPLRFPGQELPALRYEEGKSMLAETAKRWTLEWKREGQAEALIRQLEFKFGSLPEDRRAEIESAKTKALKDLSLRFVTAKRLEEVFEPRKKGGRGLPAEPGERRAQENGDEFRKGQAATLIRQLEFKFGSLPADRRAQVESAKAKALKVWIQRVLTAQQLDEVFETSP